VELEVKIVEREKFGHCMGRRWIRMFKRRG
jgi:hypothetical protein